MTVPYNRSIDRDPIGPIVPLIWDDEDLDDWDGPEDDHTLYEAVDALCEDEEDDDDSDGA
jgi:hypothetical protein